MKRIPKTLVYFLAGMLTALPIVFPKLFLIGIISFFIPAYFEYSATDKMRGIGRAYLRGVAFFWGFGITVFSWFTALYPMDFVGFDKGSALAVVCLGWFGLSLLQALFWGFLFPLSELCDRMFSTRSKPLVYSLVFSCNYVVFEWLSTKTWAAVPWGRLAVGQTDFLPMIQISSVLGSYAVSFLLVFVGFALGVGLARVRTERFHIAFTPLAVAAALLASNLIFGISRTAWYEVPKDSEKVTVAAIQGNISSQDKWTDDSHYITEKKYKELTYDAADKGAELVVYPETPIVYNLDGNMGHSIREYYESLAEETGCTIISGMFTRDDGGASENSVMAVDPDSGFFENKYVKRHLVPFGEYVPMRDIVSKLFPPLSDVSMLSDDLASGKDATVFHTEYGRIAPIICFDSIYETLAIDSIRAGGELITLSTNDSWFLDSPAVWQHNRHAVLRSVECGRYTVRSANTGVSSVISPTGKVVEKLDPLKSGYVIADVYMIDENTVYTTVGNAIVPLCAVATLSMCVLCAVKKRACNKNGH